MPPIITYDVEQTRTVRVTAATPAEAVEKADKIFTENTVEETWPSDGIKVTSTSARESY